MSKKVFITRKIPDIAVSLLSEAGCTVEVYPHDQCIPHDELIKTLQENTFDAVLCLLTDTIDSSVYDAAPTVKLYANYATGFDNIDVAEAKRRGITVTNAPGDLTSEAVAEHTLALILSLAARIVEADAFVRAGKYQGWDPMNLIGIDVVGKTLGLVGAGRIGARVAQFSKGLGLRIVYTDVFKNEKLENEYGAVYYKTIEELLPNADIISLHVPLMDSTRHLINEERLRLMKPSSYLINTSRGPIVEESALEKALREKIIAGAALDVFEFEPLIAPGLIALPNTILTPHIASASVEARGQMAEIAAQNILDFFAEKVPRSALTN